LEDKIKPIKIAGYLLICFIVLTISVNGRPVLFAQDAQEKEAVTDVNKTEKIKTELGSTQAGPASMKVYKDPVTGKFLEAPPERIPPEMPEAEKEKTSTSSEGLEEMKVDKPGGGVMIDLKGRFQQYQNATKDADGNISIRCTPTPALPINNETDTHKTPSHDEQK
jgi:hypothetical protein